MDIVELSRMVENLLRVGTIHSVDHVAVRVRVQLGRITSDWLPWFEQRAGQTTTWDPPTIGEQCMVLSPSGELANGIVLVGIHSALITPPSHDEYKHVTRYPDGAVVSYDHTAHTYLLDVPEDGLIKFSIGSTSLKLRSNETVLTTPAFRGVES